jgi:hypothetical protein
MRCQSCQSTRQVELPGELAVHFPGRENLSTPLVFVFPDIVLCLDCGSAKFTVPEGELQSIRDGVSLGTRELTCDYECSHSIVH